jgi:hypothetical protein
MEAFKDDDEERPGRPPSKREREPRWTTDHDFIRRWVEARGGRPALVRGSGAHESSRALRIDYPGADDGGRNEEIGWGEFFRKFDAANLAFVYQESTRSGDESRFSKLVDRDAIASEMPPVRDRLEGPIGEA